MVQRLTVDLCFPAEDTFSIHRRRILPHSPRRTHLVIRPNYSSSLQRLSVQVLHLGQCDDLDEIEWPHLWDVQHIPENQYYFSSRNRQDILVHWSPWLLWEFLGDSNLVVVVPCTKHKENLLHPLPTVLRLQVGRGVWTIFRTLGGPDCCAICGCMLFWIH